VGRPASAMTFAIVTFFPYPVTPRNVT